MTDSILKNPRIKIERLKVLFSFLIFTNIGQLITGIVLIYLMKDNISYKTLILWFSLLVFSVSFSIFIKINFNKKVKSKSSIDKLNAKLWEAYFLVAVLIAGITWGSAGYFLFPSDSIANQTILELIIAGIIAASINTLSPSMRAILIFIPLTFAPLMLRIYISDNENAIVLILLIFIYLLISIFGSQVFNYHMRENLSLRYSAILRESELRESEEKYRLLYEKSEDPMMLFSGSHFEMVNKAALRAFGIEKEEDFLKTPPFDFSPRYQSDGVSSIKKATKIMNIIEREGYYRFEWIYKHTDGTTHPADVTMTAIPSKGKRAVFCVMKDVSENKKIEQELILAQKKAEEANQSKSDFLANMSHEIRTPMNGVIGATELLLRDELNEKQKNHALLIKNNADSMIKIINDILDFSKIEAGKLELYIKEFNLYDLLKDFISSMANRVNEKNIDFKFSINRGIHHWYKGDTGRIRQILTNLIDNAIKFTHKGRIILSCKVTKDASKYSTLKFDIKDTGVGISKNQQEKIFRRFNQGDKSTTKKYGGTGLGLSICQQLTELMDGEISFQSEAGKGTHFWFTIKLEKARPVDTLKEDYQLDISSFENFNATALIVDDNITNQMVAKEMLKVFNLSIEVVEDGLKAVEILSKKSYDIIFMDIHMPVMDGFQATSTIRNPESGVINHNSVIVAMTASAMQGDKEKCLSFGMNDYISKPIDLNSLQIILQKWLPKHTLLKSKTKIKEITQSRKADTIHPIFDYQAIFNRLSGDQELIQKITKRFIASIKKHIDTIQKSFIENDLDAVKNMAHKLKGSASTIGCQRLSNIAYQIEIAIKKYELDKIKDLIEQLHVCYSTSKRAIDVKIK